MAKQNKVNENNFVDSVFDMALIFSRNAIVQLRDDTKEIQDVVAGDELLGWRGEYRKVVCVYRPKFFHPPMIRFGIGVSVSAKKGEYGVFLEIGEQTKLAVRNLVPNYDLVPMPKKARDISIFTDAVEVCIEDNPPEYRPSDVLKLSQKRSQENRPYLIGIEGSCLVVNDIVVFGCDVDKIKKFIKKEEDYAASKFKEKTRNNVSKIDRLRDDPQLERFVEDDDLAGDDE